MFRVDALSMARSGHLPYSSLASPRICGGASEVTPHCSRAQTGLQLDYIPKPKTQGAEWPLRTTA
jgi:hypothetical protein